MELGRAYQKILPESHLQALGEAAEQLISPVLMISSLKVSLTGLQLTASLRHYFCHNFSESTH